MENIFVLLSVARFECRFSVQEKKGVRRKEVGHVSRCIYIEEIAILRQCISPWGSYLEIV